MSAIWEFPGFHLSFVKPDWMHVVDLGILGYLLGDILWELFVALGGVHSRGKQACSKLENLLVMCAARLGMDRPIHSLTVLMIRGSATAKPRMRVKAAEARYLLPIVRETLATCFATDTQHARGRLHCVDALLSCYRVLDEWNSTTSPAQELVRSGRRFLILLRELHDSCPDARRWRLYPKHHLFVHLIEGAVINP